MLERAAKQSMKRNFQGRLELLKFNHLSKFFLEFHQHVAFFLLASAFYLAFKRSSIGFQVQREFTNSPPSFCNCAPLSTNRAKSEIRTIGNPGAVSFLVSSTNVIQGLFIRGESCDFHSAPVRTVPSLRVTMPI